MSRLDEDPYGHEKVVAVFPGGRTEVVCFGELDDRYEWEEITDPADLGVRSFAAAKDNRQWLGAT